MKHWKKKGQVFENFSALAIGIVALAITLTITFLIVSQGRESVISTNPCAATAGVNGESIYFNTTSLRCQNSTSTIFGESIAYNSTQTLGNAVDGIPGWVPLIVIASVGGVLIGLVAMFRR